MGCEPLAVFAAGRGQLAAEHLEVIESQSTQRDVADGGDDVAVDEPRVPVRSRRPDLATLARHPLFGEELAEGDRTSSLRRWVVAFLVEASGHGFGVGPIVTGGVPSSAFLAGERVGAVGDDVEAVLALDDVAHRPSVDDFDDNPKSHVKDGGSGRRRYRHLVGGPSRFGGRSLDWMESDDPATQAGGRIWSGGCQLNSLVA